MLCETVTGNKNKEPVLTIKSVMNNIGHLKVIHNGYEIFINKNVKYEKIDTKKPQNVKKI